MAADADATDDRAPVTREALYNMVWSEPMLRIAARFGVSSSYMARVCEKLNVPRPERGYWAKLEVGKASAIPALPELRPDDSPAWTRDGAQSQLERPLPKPPATVSSNRRIRPTAAPQQHPLVAGAAAHFEAGRLSYDVGYLKPAKRLLIDVAVTKSALERALSFANALFLSLEAAAHRVAHAPNDAQFTRPDVDPREKPTRAQTYNNLWTPARGTVAYLGTVAIGITIVELSHEVKVRYVGDGKYVPEDEYVPPKRSRYSAGPTWTTTKNLPTGRLCLRAYSADRRAEWTKLWYESKNESLVERIPAIVKELERSAGDIARLVAEGEVRLQEERRRRELEYERWRREEAARQTTEALKESKDDLLEVIAAWAESKRIETFFADAGRSVRSLPPEAQRRLLAKLKRARDLIGTTEALERFEAWESPEDRLNQERD